MKKKKQKTAAQSSIKKQDFTPSGGIAKANPPAAMSPEVVTPLPKNMPAVMKASITQHSGPLPSPEVLRGYAEIKKDSVDIIFRLAEEEAQHRRALEKKVVQSETMDSRLGLIFGFIATLFALGVSAFFAYKEYPITGGTLGAGTLAGVVGTFVYGSRQRNKALRSSPQSNSNGSSKNSVTNQLN